MNRMDKSNTRVCVTGGSGYIGSWLVKNLLKKGYTVHATLRNLEDKAKVGLLQSLPNAETNLVLYQADIYNPDDFHAAINGCEFSMWPHLCNMTPIASSIADSCLRSKTVKRLIYTASVVAASPLNKDGFLSKSCIDEDSWTSLDLSLTYGNDITREYTIAKTLAEMEVLRYNDEKLEVVTLACGLVGGETLLPHVPLSVEVIFSQVTGNVFGYYYGLKLMQELLGSVPLVHIEDVCEAHIFCMENPSITGRFLCAATSATVRDIADYIQESYPEFKIEDKFKGEEETGSICDSSKLRKLGFDYKYDQKKIIDESFECGKRLGALPNQ
ncbi:hypothetical protein Tsubulata_016398 [Turnera subulata]|uniref:NAD-dependent epimerase/dehydratase domain-containing protein n=1 Tax=Turnera subulata TaxID=218843 RepID=A0A9Q0F1J0_9ROSI|nr:hypothetical protein Tsubulata_016398 [Turnera subulata]